MPMVANHLPPQLRPPLLLRLLPLVVLCSTTLFFGGWPNIIQPADAQTTGAEGWDFYVPSWTPVNPESGLVSYNVDATNNIGMKTFEVVWRHMQPDSEAAYSKDVSGTIIENRVTTTWNEQMAGTDPFDMRVFVSAVDWAPYWLRTICSVDPVALDMNALPHLPVWNACVWAFIKTFYMNVFAEGTAPFVGWDTRANSRLRFIFTPGAYGWGEYDSTLLLNIAATVQENTYKTWFSRMVTDMTTIFGAYKYKLVFGGEDYPFAATYWTIQFHANDAVTAGLSVRQTKGENFDYHLNELPSLGLSIQSDGTVLVDETHVMRSMYDKRSVITELECFKTNAKGCSTNIADADIEYVVRNAAFKAVQMGVSHVFVDPTPNSGSFLNVYPNLWTYMRYALAKKREEAFDAWTVLRESTDTFINTFASAPKLAGGTVGGYATKPWIKYMAKYMRLVEGGTEGVPADGVTARGTEVRGGNYAIGTIPVPMSYDGRIMGNGKKMYFKVDPVWGLSGTDVRTTTIKVTVRDTSVGVLTLDYTDGAAANQQLTYTLQNTGKVQTVSFALATTQFSQKFSGSTDFVLSATVADIEVLMVRIVKENPASSKPANVKGDFAVPPSTTSLITWKAGASMTCAFSSWIVKISSGPNVGTTPTGCADLNTRTQTSCTAAGMTPLQAYKFTVQEACVDPTKNSPETESPVFTPSGTPATEPTTVAQTFKSTVSKDMIITWVRSNPNQCVFSSWDVYGQPSNGTWVGTWAVPMGCPGTALKSRHITTCTATNLMPGFGYQFKIAEGCDDTKANSLFSTPSAKLDIMMYPKKCSFIPNQWIIVQDLVATPATPVGCTGTPTLFTIDLALMSGMSLTSGTGTISGTPLAKQSQYSTFTLTPFNQGGAGDLFVFSLLVNPQFASGCTFTSIPGAVPILNFTRSSPSIFPVTGCNALYAPTSFSLPPAQAALLPAGITFSSVTGAIAGTPTIFTKTYMGFTVTPINQAGNGIPFIAYVLINPEKPTGCKYNETNSDDPLFSVVHGSLINPIGPSFKSCRFDPWRFYVQPAVQGGLSFNTATGTFSGTPTQSDAATVSYTVIPFNQNGAGDLFKVQIRYLPKLPVSCTYPQSGRLNVTAGVTMTSYDPQLCQNVPTSFLIDTTLRESGLFFSTTTGAITGTTNTPTLVWSYYTVTPSNQNGLGTPFPLAILVNPEVSSACLYNPSERRLTKDIVMTPLSPMNCQPVADRYYFAGSLHTGLAFDAATGTISGTPTVVTTDFATYLITPYNQKGGGVPIIIKLIVDPKVPVNCVYPYNTYRITSGILLDEPIAPRNCLFEPTSFSMDTSTLPLGLTFSTVNGFINGAPAMPSAGDLTLYATPFNQGGQGMRFPLVVEVRPQVPYVCTYPVAIPYFVVDRSVTEAIPSCTTYKADSYAISQTLPAGIVFDTVTGKLSGTPTKQSSAGLLLKVTPSNRGGWGAVFTVTLRVHLSAAPPTNVGGSYGLPTTNAIRLSWSPGKHLASKIATTPGPGVESCIFSSWKIEISATFPGGGTVPEGCSAIYFGSRDVTFCNAKNLQVATAYKFWVTEVCSNGAGLLNSIPVETPALLTSNIIPSICNGVNCGPFGDCDNGSGLCVCDGAFSGSTPYNCDSRPCVNYKCDAATSATTCKIIPLQVPENQCYPKNENYIGDMLMCQYEIDNSMTCTPATTGFPAIV